MAAMKMPLPLPLPLPLAQSRFRQPARVRARLSDLRNALAAQVEAREAAERAAATSSINSLEGTH